MDLTGTCWRFKDNINSAIEDYHYLWYINFRRFGVDAIYTELYSRYYMFIYFEYIQLLYCDADSNYWAYDDTEWRGEDWRTIIILGGDDVESPNLNAFLQEAAVQVPLIETKANDKWQYGKTYEKTGEWKLSNGIYVKDNTWI